MDKSEPTPTISRILPDGTLIELLYDPVGVNTSFAIANPSGEVTRETAFTTELGERLIPYSASNNLIASGCVLLPSNVNGDGDLVDLVDEIRVYLGRYAALSPAFESIAPYYVLLSWVYDAFNEVPYLRFKGGWGTGKTRCLLTVGSICYKPFLASGASTVSPIFHILDTFGGTLVLDEADFRFSDATSDLTKILNNGTMRGLPVLRTMTNRHRELNPQAFKVFGPKVIAMRENFADQALESRFLTEETSRRTLPADMPLHLPNQMRADALTLRNRLLAWRLRSFAKVCIRPDRQIAGLSARANQMAVPLLSLIEDDSTRATIAEYLQTQEVGSADMREREVEDRVLRTLDAAFTTCTAPRVADVAAGLSKSPEEVELFLNPKAVGSIIRSRLGIATTKVRGVYVVPNRERAAVSALVKRRSLA